VRCAATTVPLGYNAGMDVHPLDDRHLDAAHELWDRTEHLGPVPRDEVAALRAVDPELVLGASRDGRLVGVVLGSFDGRRGWINRLAVAPDARRGGTGAALVSELERRLQARGCRQVNLLVFGDNVGGRAFWDRRGYTATTPVVLYHRRLDGRDATC
jgi:ribosomal protein S18 acetylase RimI-like enzyme